jgi:NAD(P)-dependent dehydrogenase (short-subunit alcohol dehydrogenase family)
VTAVLEQFRLDGRVALVTGGARGLGLAMARALAEAGATVAITSRDRDSANVAANELATSTHAKISGFAVDVTAPALVDALVAEVVSVLGRLDILVNNAGGTQRGPLESLSVEQWDQVVETNLRGTWLCAKAAAPHLRASTRGRIINIASMFAHVGMPDRTPYVAAKGGVVALTRALAMELAVDKVTVNAICPGPFMTNMHDAQARANMLAAIPLGRWGDPAELGPAVVYLASDAAAYMTGATLTIDGGYTAR